MTLQQVHLKENCAERNQKEDLRLDGLAERPPLHLGLEAHVGDLQAEAVPVHADQAGLEFAQGTMSGRLSTEERRLVVEEEEGEVEVEEEAGGVGTQGTCAASNRLSTAFPSTRNPPLVAALVAGPYLYYLSNSVK